LRLKLIAKSQTEISDSGKLNADKMKAGFFHPAILLKLKTRT